MSGAEAAPPSHGAVPSRFPVRWRFVLALVLLAGFLLGLRPLSDVNLDFHLNAGRWILAHGTVPAGDTFTFGAAGRGYLDLHWLFQAAAYSLFRAAGHAGLSVSNALLALALLGLLALRARRLGAGPAATCWVLLAAAVAVHQRFLMRPENVSYLLLALLALLLDRYLAAGAARGPGEAPGARGDGLPSAAAARLLWPVPLLHLLWVNTQGLFVLGLVVTGTYWVSASLRARRPDGPLAAVLALSAAASLANPYGLRGLLFPLELLARLARADVFSRNIGELRPLWEIGGLFEDRVLYAFAAALLVALAATARRRAPHELLLPALFAPLAAVAVRNVPLFVVVAAPVLAAALSELARRLSGALPAAARGAAPSRAAAALCAAVVLGLLARMHSGAFFRGAGLAPTGIGVGLDAASRPVAAARFLLDRGLDGRILNSSNTGSWLGWVLPQPVFIDMRLEVMGEELFAAEAASWRDGGLGPLLERWRPQIVLLDHGGAARGWIRQLRALGDWRLVFADAVAAVYLRRGYAPEVPALDPGTLPAREGIDRAAAAGLERLLARPAPGRARRWLAGFHEPSLPDPAPHALGRFCEESGAPAAAEAFYLAALAASPDLSYPVYGDLAVVYAGGGRPDLALRCYAKYGEYEPGSAWAANGTGMARAMLGDLEGALRDFTTALGREPGFEEARLNRALARLQLGDAAGAALDYRRVLADDPGHEAAREGLRAAEELLR